MKINKIFELKRKVYNKIGLNQKKKEMLQEKDLNLMVYIMEMFQKEKRVVVQYLHQKEQNWLWNCVNLQ